jgi:hypothetical protein
VKILIVTRYNVRQCEVASRKYTLKQGNITMLACNKLRKLEKLDPRVWFVQLFFDLL